MFAILLLALPSLTWSYPGQQEYETISDEELDSGVRSMNRFAILEAGRRRRKQVIPDLDRLAASEDTEECKRKIIRSDPVMYEQRLEYVRCPQHKAARLAAKKALARMGDIKYLKEFISDLSSKDGWKRIDAIRALGYVGDKRAAKYLAPILDETGGPPKYSKHEPAPSYAYTAEQAFDELFPEVLEQFRKENTRSKYFFSAQWKAWWKTNKAKFQQGIE